MSWLPALASFFSGLLGVLLGGKIAWHQFVASKTIDLHEKILSQAADTLAKVHRVSSIGRGDSAAAMHLLNKQPDWVSDLIAEASDSCQKLSIVSEDLDIRRICDELAVQLDTAALCHQVLVSLIRASQDSAGTRSDYAQSISDTRETMLKSQDRLRSSLDSLKRHIQSKFSIRQSLSKSTPFDI